MFKNSRLNKLYALGVIKVEANSLSNVKHVYVEHTHIGAYSDRVVVIGNNKYDRGSKSEDETIEYMFEVFRSYYDRQTE